MSETLEGVVCFCGSPASLRSNSLLYNGKEYGNGKAWICGRFPECRGSVGSHPDGSPLGTIPDEETKQLRRQVHALFDPIWKQRETSRQKKRYRALAYGYLRRLMELPIEECHIGHFNKEQCERAIARMKETPFKKPAPKNPKEES